MASSDGINMSVTHAKHGFRVKLHRTNDGGLSATADTESPFLRVADYVSAAMGRPTNIMVWLFLVIAWTLTFALGGAHIASGSWLPTWFTSQGFNFPLNLITTVAELFIGFLVAAASNRSERNLEATLARIEQVEGQLSGVMAENNKLVQDNTDLTTKVHSLTETIADQTCMIADLHAVLPGLQDIHVSLAAVRDALPDLRKVAVAEHPELKPPGSGKPAV